jgi:hypothetical protein
MTFKTAINIPYIACVFTKTQKLLCCKFPRYRMSMFSCFFPTESKLFTDQMYRMWRLPGNLAQEILTHSWFKEERLDCSSGSRLFCLPGLMGRNTGRPALSADGNLPTNSVPSPGFNILYPVPWSDFNRSHPGESTVRDQKSAWLNISELTGV